MGDHSTLERTLSTAFSAAKAGWRFAAQAGAGNLSTDPQLVDLQGFVPQNKSLRVGQRQAVVEYDRLGWERTTSTTVGAAVVSVERQ